MLGVVIADVSGIADVIDVADIVADITDIIVEIGRRV